MTWRFYLLLALLSLATLSFVASLQPSPGYMDADYYFSGGLQLVKGRGFTEPYLWNYLDNPTGLPHPSHAYWMPLASLLAAAGAFIFGPSSWLAARIGFLLLGALIPPITAALAWSFTSRRDLSLISGFLAVFSVFYLVFLPVTDTFGLYMILGGLFFIIVNRKSSGLNPLMLGIIAGLMHLARADGIIWLATAFIVVLFIFPKPSNNRFIYIISFLLLVTAGYLLVMGPWFIRNLTVFGSPLAPGSSRSLWLKSYDQLFTYPSSQISFSSWWQTGLAAISRVRVWALGLNLSNMLSVQGEIFLFPFIMLGAWYFRKDRRIQLAGLMWLLTIFIMTVIFPFAGARGGFFHSGASVQMIWWVLAPVGLDRVIIWGNHHRGWMIAQSRKIFGVGFVVIAMILSTLLIYERVLGGGGHSKWGQENEAYSQMTSMMVKQGMTGNSVVIVANPPGFYLSSGNPAIAVPDGDINTLLSVATRYGGKYVILEEGATPAGLLSVYNNPVGNVGLKFLGEIMGAHIYAIQP